MPITIPSSNSRTKPTRKPKLLLLADALPVAY